MKTYPKVFIVVLNYNGAQVIKQCLSSLFNLEYPNFSVVVVDNDSKDGSFEMAKNQFGRAYFIKNEKNLGFATGNNVGIRFSLERGADWVWLLNNDTEVDPSSLKELVFQGEKAGAGILSPVIFERDGEKIWFAGGRIDWLRMKVVHFQRAISEEFYLSDFITGCAMLVKKDVFKKIGLLDEDFFLYYEDADFGERARRAGFKKGVATRSWIYHFENSQKDFSGKLYWLVLSGLLFFKKDSFGLKKIWIWLLIFLRRMKNIKNLVFKKEEKSRVIRRAFKDFKKASHE
ncbi:MAG: glycosyltransferase family 2 protein [Patescibacteria group bacterium]